MMSACSPAAGETSPGFPAPVHGSFTDATPRCNAPFVWCARVDFREALVMRTQLALGGGAVRASRLTVGLATSGQDVLDAQRLRHLVFGEELGARLPGARDGVDRDGFDLWCEHLIVRDSATGEVVGTYRILPPAEAAQLGRYYSETEFDLSRLAHLRPRLVEVGRSCIHPDYRTGATILLLWSGIARYMRAHGHEYLIGCASIGMRDGGQAAASLWRRLGPHLAPPEYRVFPRCPLPLAALDGSAPAELPPLVRGYLALGAWVCGAPAWDPDFHTADLAMLLSLSRVPSRYARHFLGEPA
jgi:putative hemolysin